MNTKIEVKDKNNTNQLIKVSAFRPEVRTTTPHKHNGYFEIIYLSHGGGTHYVDHTPYPIKAPVVFTVTKEQVHHWDMTHQPSGYVLLLKKEFVDKSLDDKLKHLLTDIGNRPCILLRESSIIEILFETMTKDHSFTVIEGLLKALMAKILDSTQSPIQKFKNNQSLYLQYRELLNERKVLTNQVSHYAKLLHTTPQNLNTICQKANNQTATQVLAEYVINEAKRLLYYTDYTVSQIAHALGFVDNSHFVKYFKRYTSLTPLKFRKTQNADLVSSGVPN